MSPTLESALRSWPLEWSIVVPLAVAAFVYIVGWRQCVQRSPHRFGARQLLCFLGGLGCIFAALASPIEPFASLLLSVHMVQHLLLMMGAPLLIWLGSPLLPLLHGLPTSMRRAWIGPLFRARWLRRSLGWLASPIPAWTLFIAAGWLWHWPAAYQLALQSPDWHYVEHATFLTAALLFWFPVVEPFPSRPAWSRWWIIPYLLLADVSNTILSAILTFSDRVLYPHYEAVPRLGAWTPLADQGLAGVLMWAPGSLAFLLPIGFIGYELLTGRQRRTLRRATTSRSSLQRPYVSLPILGSTDSSAVGLSRRVDLLQIPIIGGLLRRRSTRRMIQWIMLLLSGLLVWDGFTGPQAAGMNLAGVLPWIHWRGMVIVGLLAVGNVFCYACPFTLPRRWAKRWSRAVAWPAGLRNKWLALALVIAFFWAYEVFSLWSDPWWTAAIALGYFVVAFLLDAFFQGAPFCKFLCPIGQFHFVQSTLSPFEVAVKNPSVCPSCVTKDCIRGNSQGPGCEMGLFQPFKAGNLDCTFCLDCVVACPIDNVGVLAVVPGSDLVKDRARSGVGRLAHRPDLAALVLVLVAAAFVNAAGMVAPVLEWEDALTQRLGLASRFWIATSGLVLGMVVIPSTAAAIVAWLSRRFCGASDSLMEFASTMVYSLIPIGLGMWSAHYLFHFLTSFGVIMPIAQRFAADAGILGLGEPAWEYACCAPPATWLIKWEILLLDLGLVGSVVLGFQILRGRFKDVGRAARALIPWALLATVLFAVGVWILFQPMEMRGTMTPGG